MSSKIMVSKNFSFDELKCKCGNCTEGPNANFVVQLQKLRNWWGKPMTINSCARCQGHNYRVNGKPGSMHLVGRAADIKINGSQERYELVKLAIEMGFTGIGVASTFIHVDNRPLPVMWKY